MKRREAIEMILHCMKDEDVALFTTGMISREAFDIKDRESHFYVIGSMGLVSSVGLGIALNTTKRVFIFDGDGSILMDMGTMVMIASARPANLVHIVLDNETYDSTGGQPTLSRDVDLAKIAESSGYAHSVKIGALKELKSACRNIAGKKGPHFVLIKVLEKSNTAPERVDVTPFRMKERFEQFLKGA